MKCDKKTEVYSRIVGYFRPVQNWNEGKKQEFIDRSEFVIDKPAQECVQCIETAAHCCK
ncbi:MAG TPA: anaerobic ribonucleoside-triphosphate reductase [Candidatus Nanoarchaeia archaeon]|nr:anaerobic ribonucleoside-triphosphate reductase [Candidatus Nanoarchaeia archaeon]